MANTDSAAHMLHAVPRWSSLRAPPTTGPKLRLSPAVAAIRPRPCATFPLPSLSAQLQRFHHAAAVAAVARVGGLVDGWVGGWVSWWD